MELLNKSYEITKLHGISVVRDDLLPGGTKQRAVIPFLKGLMQNGHRHFYYASPFCGFAQVALAYAGLVLKTKVTVICERDKRKSVPAFHLFSILAQTYGANIVMVDSLEEAEHLATARSKAHPRGFKIPMGFNRPEFIENLKCEVQNVLADIEARNGTIKRIWLPIGSGTLVRTFLSATTQDVKLMCVNVKVLAPDDERIRALSDSPRVKIFNAPMAFHDEAKNLPEIPSNLFYDAKIWSFIEMHGHPGDLWWNVAR